LLSSQKIQDIIDDVESTLLTMSKIRFDFDRKWSSNFPAKAGIYAIFDNEELIYIGETANIKERMKEVKRTYNHSFRRKLGKHLNQGAVIENGKFDEVIELALNGYFTNQISFSFKVLNFGRLEVESHLIHRHHKNGLLNSIGKRNRIT